MHTDGHKPWRSVPNQMDPCQRVVSTSWCTSDGAGCDVGSVNLCSQDAACSHTTEHSTIRLDTQTDVYILQTRQPYTESHITKGHETLRMHCYVKQGNGLRAKKGPWETHDHIYIEHKAGQSFPGLGWTKAQTLEPPKIKTGTTWTCKSQYWSICRCQILTSLTAIKWIYCLFWVYF